jgi:formamidopyrimidine-DNA glycosylase
MPELPEVETIASELNSKLKNRIIKSVDVNAPKMVAVGPDVVSNIRRADKRSAKRFASLLEGHKFLSVKRRAKLMIFDLQKPSPRPSPIRRRQGFGGQEGRGGRTKMLVHLKMTGQFIFEDKHLREKTGGSYRIFNKADAPQVKLPGKHTHVVFSFTDGSHLYFNDVRKFGYLKLVRDNELGQVKELKEFGPEPLGKDFTFALLFTAVNKRAKSKIKQFLMDPKVVAGIGNIYSDEILFHAHVRPSRTVASLSDKELKDIFKYIKIVLKQAIKAKGSSVGDFIRTDGSFGQMGKYHFVYGRGGLSCKKCGTPIKSVKMNGRTASFCPKCQV